MHDPNLTTRRCRMRWAPDNKRSEGSHTPNRQNIKTSKPRCKGGCLLYLIFMRPFLSPIIEAVSSFLPQLIKHRFLQRDGLLAPADEAYPDEPIKAYKKMLKKNGDIPSNHAEVL